VYCFSPRAAKCIHENNVLSRRRVGFGARHTLRAVTVCGIGVSGISRSGEVTLMAQAIRNSAQRTT
jgi:hypothetical protein